MLDVVVVGGGPTGVETTGALAELMHALRDRAARRARARSPSSTAGRPCSRQFSKKAHDYSLKKLTEAGADVKLEVGVTAVHADHVEFDDGSTIPARTVVWGGGESGSAVAQNAGPAPGRAAVSTSSPT